MKNSLRLLAVVSTLALAPAFSAVAGEQCVDGSGFAVSGFDVVAYFDKALAPPGKSQPVPTPCKTPTTVQYNGATFAFATTANRDRFLANPAEYALQYDGHCAFGVAKGGKAPGDPQFWRVLDGKLSLNVPQSVAAL